jgi:putative DNA primase/helicase
VAQGEALLPQVESSTRDSVQPIEGEELFRRVVSLLLSEVVMTKEQATFVALWVLYTHAHDNFETSVILAIISATKRSGKTRLLERISRLVPRPLAASSATAAAVYRVIPIKRPTLLLDELDLAPGDQSEFNRILVSGLRRETAHVLRCVGDQHEPKQFSVWCPKVVCRIGDIKHSSLNDRAIIVRMQRATLEELKAVKTESRDLMRTATDTLRAQAEQWATASGVGLAFLEERRNLLPTKDSRYQDLWAPLLAVADMIDEKRVGAEARAAAAALYDERETAGDEHNIRLLLDIDEVFRQEDKAFLSTEELLIALRKDTYGLWATVGERGQGLNAEGLASRLRPFGVKSKQLRVGEKRERGYFKDPIKNAIARYVGAFDGESSEGGEVAPQG